MSKSQIPLATSSWDNAEYVAMQRVIDSGNFTMGKEVGNFEDAFSNKIGSKYSVMVNSGSSANLLLIASLFYRKNNKLKPGDEVIVPAVSWSTTYFPLSQYNLKIKYVDIDLDTLNFDINKLSEAITERTRLIFTVNLLGNPNDFDEIYNMIKGRNIILIEDNCESLGAKYNGRNAGTFGLASTFSTFFSHHISTMEGGVICTDDEEIYQILLSLRSHGWTRNLPKKNFISGMKSDDNFEESFKFILPGYNLRPLEFSGAIGIEQLNKLSMIIQNRRKNAQVFQSIMSEKTDFIIQKEIGDSSWFGFSIIIKNESKKTRKMLRDKLEQLSIEYRPIVGGNFIKNPVNSYIDFDVSGNLDNANHLHNNGLFIGNHHYDISDDLNRLLEL